MKEEKTCVFCENATATHNNQGYLLCEKCYFATCEVIGFPIWDAIIEGQKGLLQVPYSPLQLAKFIQEYQTNDFEDVGSEIKDIIDYLAELKVVQTAVTPYRTTKNKLDTVLQYRLKIDLEY